MSTPIDWTLPPEEILGLLQESSMVKTGLKIRFNDIEDQFPNTNYRSVVATSVAKFAKVDAEAQIVMIAASGEGADLSHPSSQGKIQYIANEDNWPTELTQWVLTRCVQLKYRWQSEGFDAEPTLSQVATRKSLEATRITWSGVRGVVDDRLHTGAITTWAEVVAIVEAN